MSDCDQDFDAVRDHPIAMLVGFVVFCLGLIAAAALVAYFIWGKSAAFLAIVIGAFFAFHMLPEALAEITFKLSTRRKRVDPSICTECGYDLRATPDRCPECGTAVERPK